MHEKCPNKVFSGPYSVQMRENADQKKGPDTFHTANTTSKKTCCKVSR